MKITDKSDILGFTLKEIYSHFLDQTSINDNRSSLARSGLSNTRSGFGTFYAEVKALFMARP